MAYGELKVDSITFTNGGTDTTVSVSGLVQNPTFSGDITVTGTISGDFILGGTTVSGATVTGTAGEFGTVTGNTGGFTTVTGTTFTGTTVNAGTGVFTSQISGATVTGNIGQFTTLTGTTAGFTTVTGTTVTGSAGQFGTVTGNTAGFTTVTGTTVTGTTANFTSGVFTNISGGTHTITSGVFDDGTAAAPSITFTGDPDTGIYSPGANQVAISTNGTERVEFGTSEIVINNGGEDIDFRVEGDTEENLLLVDAGNDLVRIGGGYNILKGFNRRPPLHRGPLFYKTAALTISIVADSALNGFFYDTATAVAMPGSFSNNVDYAIWQHPTTGALVADASFTSAPAGATGGSIVGGFHHIPSGRPTAVNSGSPTAAAEILEYSIWDLTWRPACPDPRGMSCIEGGFWIDLYMCGTTSYAGSNFTAVPSSRIGLTIADGSSPPLVPAQYGGNGVTAYGNGKWYVFAEVARSFGKKLPSYSEFAAAAFGGPEAGSRGTDPGTVIWERVSKFGLAQSTGTLWTWAEETCTSDPPTAWTTGTETEGRGQVYGSPTRALILGGSWGSASNSGSRCADWDITPWYSSGSLGARFVAGHLILA